MTPVLKRRYAGFYEALPTLLAAGVAFSLLCGTALAQELEVYNKPQLRPPVTAAPYGTKPKGSYVLPGTFSKKGELAPLPKKEPVRMPPPPPQETRKLPDIRTMPELSGTHAAETPQMFRAVTPATRGTTTLNAPAQTGYAPRYRPAPAPVFIPEPADAPLEGEWIALEAPAQQSPVAETAPPPPPAMKVEQTAPVKPLLSLDDIPPSPPVAAKRPMEIERTTSSSVHDSPVVIQKRTVVVEPAASTPSLPLTPHVPMITEPAMPLDASVVIQKRTVVMEPVTPPIPLDAAPRPVHNAPVITQQRTTVEPVAPTAPMPLDAAPLVIEKRTVVVQETIAPTPTASPHEPVPVIAEKTITEVVEIPRSETGKMLEIPTETTLLVPVEPVEQQELSPASQAILDKTPSGMDSPKTIMRTPKPVVLTRSDKPDGLDVRTHEALGLKIEVRKAPPNVEAFLQQGYDHLMAGNLSIAAGFYEEARRASPRNENALFGLATTYQRMGRRDEARDIYGELLAINPSHREGLNNFMVLLADEAPLAAIDALEQLETENPDFSPIPAQLGSVYNRIGNHEMAARKLARALQLSPDNLAYKYNLAIALDRLGDRKQASDLYMELIEAYNLGGILPGNVDDIRNRVIFLNK